MTRTSGDHVNLFSTLVVRAKVASSPGAKMTPQWLGLIMSRTNVHGPKDVRALGVRLNTSKAKSFAEFRIYEADTDVYDRRWGRRQS